MRTRGNLLFIAVLLACALVAVPASAVHVQCPADNNDDGISDDPNVLCMTLAAGDGFINMADGYPVYIFGFSNATGITEMGIMSEAMLKAEFPAPTIELKEGQEFYLNVTNVGMVMRPDLFDPHTVHFHGFVNASTVFDGEPMASFGVNMGANITYYYKPVDPGTYMYHCHVEATEHMQMGMLGNIYIRPAQDGTTYNFGGKNYTKFAYNDGDGSTGYDVAYPIQIHAMDSNFHDLHIAVQPLPFANLFDNYPMLNGRGYPDTINTSALPNSTTGDLSQKISSLITADIGDRILLRVSNLSFDFYTLTTPGLTMQVVGRDAKILRSAGGQDLYREVTVLDLGGGQSADVIIDTDGVPAGTYFLHTSNLHHLSNGPEELGGMMTEIVINP